MTSAFESRHARAFVVALDRTAGPDDGIDVVAIRDRDAIGIPRLMRAVVEAVGARGPFPEVDDRCELLDDTVRVDDAGTGEDGATQQREVRYRPQVDRVDLVRELVAGAADLLRWHLGRDLAHHLRIAAVALDARDHDVRGHRDECGLERGALHRQRVGDLAVVPKPLVERVAVPALTERRGHGVLTATLTAAPDDAGFGAAVDLDHVAVGGLAVVERRRHHARHLVLAAHDPDVRERRARKADDRGQLVEDRREERGAGVTHARDDTFGGGVHQRQDVVRRGKPAPRAADGWRREHAHTDGEINRVVGHDRRI